VGNVITNFDADLSVFVFFRKNVNVLRSAIVYKVKDKHGNELIEIQKEVAKFFWLLKSQSKLKLSSKMTALILNELKNLLLFVGRLSSFDTNVINELISNNRKQSAVTHYYHLCMDIWWASSQNLLILNAKSEQEISLTRNSLYPTDFRSQLIEIIFSDLIFLASQRFYHNFGKKDICNLSPFICKCMKQFFFLLSLLVDQDNVLTNLHPFWLHFNKIMDALSTESSQETQWLKYFTIIPYNLAIQNNIELFKIWLISNLIPLFGYDKSGHFDEKKLNTNQDCNMNALIKSVTLFLKEQEKASNNQSFKTLPSLLNLCLRLSQLCTSSVELLLPLIDFFMKNIYKEPSYVASSEIIPKSAAQWSKALKQRFKHGSVSDCEDVNLTLFLILISLFYQ